MEMSEEKLTYRELVTEEGTYRTTFNEMYRRRKPWTPVNPKHILSYIPGEVVTILAEEGQRVHAGDDLMLYKAMKMENRIKAPMDGKIKKIHVDTGQNLPKGTLMIEFE